MKSVQTLCQDCGNGLEKYNDKFDVYEYMSLYTSYYIIIVNPDFSEVFPLQSEYAPRSLISGNLRTQYVGLSLSRDRISNSDLGSSIKRFTYTLS